MVSGFLFLVEASYPVKAQIAQSVTPVSSASPDYVCVHRGPDSRVWQRSVVRTNTDGTMTTNVQAYTELHSGVCYQKDGQLVDSVEEIDLTVTGAQAVQGANKVQWAGNINTLNAVQLTSPTGQIFSSTVYGLSYRDASTGSNVLIASLHDSIGEVVGQNRVIYTNAFSGINADVEYFYKMEGLEQNIVLREQPPSPANYNLNPETSYFEVVTRFLTAPEAAKRTVTSASVVDDQVIYFADTLMGQGTAFIVGNSSQTQGCRVTKHWVPQADGSAFLYEEVPYSALTNMASELPLHSSNEKASKRIRRTAAVKPQLQKASDGMPGDQGMKLAREDNHEKKRAGVVIDYMQLGSSNYYTSSNFVFQGDTTYYISGKWYYYGSPGTIIFEGGAVIKYTTNATIFNFGRYAGPGIFDGTTYRPTVFTAWNDNSVGTPLTSSPGTLTWVNLSTCYVEEAGGGTSTNLVNNARFSYNMYAYTDYSDPGFVFRDCQFLGGVYAIATESAQNVAAKNILCVGCSNFFCGHGTETVDAENVTVDSCLAFAMTNSVWGPCTYNGGITNSILTACDHSTSLFTTQYTVITNSGSNIYQIVGAGGYYSTNSSYVNAGTTNIDPVLLADLQTKTTYPPIDMVGLWFTSNYTFYPQAQRDTGTPDLGYHYDPLDYAVFFDISNATLTILPGTAIATCDEQGIWLYTNGVMNCEGTATSPDYLVRYNTVQEQSNTNWEFSDWGGSFIPSVITDSSSATFTFTEWSVLASDEHFQSAGGACPVEFENCQLYGGVFGCTGPSITSTNCLYSRVQYSLTGASEIANFCNNLFLDGSLTYRCNTNIDTWVFRDNLLDETTITNLNGESVAVCSHNAYVTTNYGVIIPENYDQILTSSPAFETGALGDYYYPTNLTSLIHTGSQPAPDAGLYHYTVTTNNVIEGTNIVSIGFHYVAVGADGLPLDTGPYGVPDYLSDINGDGITELGELPFGVTIDNPINGSVIY